MQFYEFLKSKILQEMETFYKKVIYDICQLIKQKSFKRAVQLSQFLAKKGFKTKQLIVSHSFAERCLNGPQSALKLISQYKQFASSLSNETNCQQIAHPLLQIAELQYNTQLQNIKQSLLNLQKLIPEQVPHEQTQLHEILSALKQNYKHIIKNVFPKIENEQLKENDPSKMMKKLFYQINQITNSYFIQKDQVKNNLQSTILLYGNIYLQYDDIKQKILQQISQQLNLKSNKKVNFNTNIRKKTGKTSQYILKGSNTKLNKNNSNKQIIVKQIKSSLQKKDSFSHQKLRNRTKWQSYPKKNQVFSGKSLSELKILLQNVNKFIQFFKNELKLLENKKNDQENQINNQLQQSMN